jgi:glyoxylate/hydroxypyruvate reductase A
MNVVMAARLGDDERAAWWTALRKAAPQVQWWTPEEAERHPEAVEAAVVANPPPGALAAYPRLRLVQSLWAGVDRLLAGGDLAAHVPLARMVDPAMTAAMAQTVCWAVLGLHRGFLEAARHQAAARWQPLVQRRADECQVLLLGQGVLGTAAHEALQTLGYRPLGWSRRDGTAALDEALAQTDVLVNLLPLTPQTRGLLNARVLARLRPGAGLVNLARGAHLVEADLLHALTHGPIAHAVLDVFEQEPLPPDHPFWAHPRIRVLPHVAAQTDPRTAAAVVADNLRRLAQGLPLQHLVDRDRGY